MENLRRLVAPLIWVLPFFLPVQAAPDEEALGKSRGYPAAPTLGVASQDNHIIWSNSGGYERFFGTRPVRASNPQPMPRATNPTPIRYQFEGRTLGLQDYLDRRRVTSLVVIKDGVIHHEHYQYDRNEAHRFNSASMGKSFNALLVGWAIEDGAIESVMDPVERYLPALKGTAFEGIPIRDFLTMSSGLDWSEGATSGGHYRRLLQLQEAVGGMDVLLEFRALARPHTPGTRFFYSSLDSEVLGRVVAAATRKPIAAYLEEKLWQPLGAERQAVWYLDRAGVERAHCCVGATARDYARVGVLLAQGGRWNGRQIISPAWLDEMTRLHGPHLSAARIESEAPMGYGYQVWIPGPGQVSFRGFRGQTLLVDRRRGVVMLQTAVYAPGPQGRGNFAELDALWEGVVRSLAP
jgi:CubicO group peptidase (beta-lactamase class C family)